MRRHATGWVAKILLSMLVLSFAVWGIADVFRGYGQGSLARVGSTEISLQQYQRAQQLELDALAQQFGRRLTSEQARMFGIDQRVLSRLIGSAAVDAHARSLGLALSETTVADVVRRDPALKGTDGKFSRFALDNILRQVGLSEVGFLREREKEEVREQLTGALLGAIAVPDPLVTLLYNYREETRKVAYFNINPATAIKIGEPDEAKLRETYDANPARFAVPEQRRLAVLELTGEDAKARVPVTDQEIAAAYEQDKQRFNIPEKRRIEQIAFKDKAEADKAAAAITAGKSFEDVAKEAGFKESDVKLGSLAKSELIDPKIAEAAFALEKDKVSAVVEGRFSTVVVKVTEIVPGRQRPLDEVKGEVRDRLAAERANKELHDLHDQVEEARATGRPLKEVAEQVKLKYTEVPSVTRAGKAPDGSTVFEGPDASRKIEIAFSGNVGVESEAVDLRDGGYAWIDVLAVAPEKQRTFEEVKGEIAPVWRENETRRLLRETAATLAERAAKGESMETLAKDAGGKLETSGLFKRFGGAPGLPEAAVGQAFAVAKDAGASADTQDGTSRVVLKVVEVNPAAAATKEDLDKLRGDLARQMQGDVITEYVVAAQERVGVSVNEAAWRRAIGADTQQQ
jgi:peptidyl-prolyl cis-trans isomerase D